MAQGGSVNELGGSNSGGGGVGGGKSSGGASSGGTNSGGSAMAGDTNGGVGGSIDSEGGAGGSTGGDGNAGAGGDTGTLGPIAEEVTVGPVWSGHPVDFAIHTQGTHQFIGFYDPDRRMVIAHRELGQTTWQRATLPTQASWDSHEWIRLTLDKELCIHVAGNMHNDPLTYFRTTSALDVSTFVQYTSMVGTNESSVTYPEFFHDARGDIIFTYRDGMSGNGNTYVNVYDADIRTWRRLFGTALIDGEGQRNAYLVGPKLGPDGYYHLVWVWRDTADAQTNHDLSYARSRDMLNWETAGGKALTLPIKISTADIVDPVPAGGGMINNNTKVGFDADNRPVVVYHKFESPTGATQLYNARFENGAWVVHKTTTRWGYRWNFSGQGTLIFPIEVEGIRTQRDGTLTQRYFHAYETNVDGKTGWGAFRLNSDTLVAEALIEQPLDYPRELAPAQSATAGMASRWAADSGQGPDPDIYYMARWETLDSNRDQPRDMIPPPTTLKVYGFRHSAMNAGGQ